MGDTVMRGTTAAQDSRFANKEALALKQTKFPKHFSEKVDLRKVNISVLRQWIAQRVTTLIGIEDDIVVEFVFGMLEDKDNPLPDPKKMQISLTGFMDKHGAAAFMDGLWTLLLSAQATVGGVPAEFIAAKKAELEKKQLTDRSLQDQMMDRKATMSGNRESASDSFDRRRDGPTSNTLPQRPGGPPNARGLDRLPPRRSPPPRNEDYRRGPPPRRFDDRDRERDSGYGPRGGSRYAGRDRSRSRSPPRGYGGYRRRSPSPRRRSPSPRREASYRRRSPSPRRRSPSPRRRERSITPPLRAKRVPSREREKARRREDTPPVRGRRSPSPDSRSPSPSPPPMKRETRGRSTSRTPTPDDARSRSDTRSKSRSRSRDRSPTITPPRKRLAPNSPTPSPPRRSKKYSPSPSPPSRRRSPSPPPRRRRRSSTSLSPRRTTSPFPPPKRRGSGEDDGGERIVKKGRGRFTQEDDDVKEEVVRKEKKTKLEGPLKKSKWAQDD